MRAQQVEFVTPKRSIGVTFSVRMQDTSAEMLRRITGIQDRIQPHFAVFGSDSIESAEELSPLIFGTMHRSIVYRYPKDRLHFSILNLIHKKDIADFETARKDIENNKWFTDLITYFTQDVYDAIQFPLQLEIDTLYIPPEGVFSDSIALNARPLDATLEQRLECLQTDSAHVLSDMGVPETALGIWHKLRNGRFAINIFRFLDPEGKRVATSEEFSATIESIQKSLAAQPISITVEKPVIVISDQYLANRDPVVRTLGSSN